MSDGHSHPQDETADSPNHTQDQEVFENTSLRRAPRNSSNDPNFTTTQRVVAEFERAIFSAAESIPGPEEQDAWISSCLSHLSMLDQLSCVNKGNGTGQEGQSNASYGRNRAIRARSFETTETPAAVNLQATHALSLDSSPSQPSSEPIYQEGATEEASPGGQNVG
ncbi:uncharacterized protein BDZ99DRAFT_523137 [Mytilinidion resinicola]|uniref:Uncharacterized protein n=1 Tax=Mytilinidion resinicola TaxID=574789 RepID=A0A6A6YFC0_9PEZI|nr:uncharacterized protein BDZ99DRAFT_523137 [Mytilinidion resinicola]KAF2807526.1 hypothetical protein BDZ99DRAFT_523137 [Mytilinidion resinicola]